MSEKIDRGQQTAHEATYSQDPEMNRSTHWPHVRDQFLTSWLALHPEAKAIEGAAWEVHHKIPFHLGVLLGRGYIELDPRNLIVVMREPIDYHLLVGHLDDFKSWNIEVVKELALYGGKLYGGTSDGWPEVEIRSNEAWQGKHLHRPRPWKEMTDLDKNAVRTLIDQRLPIVAAVAA